MNLAGLLAKENKKVLIIDMDSQGNALISFGENPDKLHVTISDVLRKTSKASDAIINVYRNIDIIGANDDMDYFEFDIIPDKKNYPYPYDLLMESMKDIVDDYDYILIDSPPNSGLIQGNILKFAHKVIIPFQPETYSMRSLIKIINMITTAIFRYNHDLSVLGVVGTMVDYRTSLHSEIMQMARKYCNENNIPMFYSSISKSIRYASAIAYDELPATLTSGNNHVVEEYKNLLKEIEDNG